VSNIDNIVSICNTMIYVETDVQLIIEYYFTFFFFDIRK